VVAAVVVKVVGYAGPGYYPFLQLRHFVVGAAMLAVFYGPVGRACARVLEHTGPAAKWIAGISHRLYVLHYPLLVQWKFSYSVPGFLVTLVLVMVLAYGVERVLPNYLPKAPKT
jgi:peptidoglycan/LPS O-acetylase OafA/YrhL